ncbi:hypothetical protein SDC9_183409 [bioreactor metagenome]|uniref:Uncharacterized protein n=1 Tax=bioreactor metagenome TaxID=1076179 RepID=A0A645HBL0_9ZZZZ
MILRQGVRHEYVRANLAAPFNLFLFALDIIDFVVMLAFLDLQKLRLEHTHRDRSVLRLRTLVLAGDDDARRNMRDADGTLCLVDMLPPRAGGTVGIDFQILFADLHLQIIIRHFRHHLNRRERCMPAPGRVKRGDAHEPVNAHLAF